MSSGGNYYLEIMDDSQPQNVMATHKMTNPYPSLAELKKELKNW
jgi:hypothetical protein